MRILFFITGLGMGGAEVLTVGLANRFSQEGHEVAIVYLNGENLHSANILPQVEVYALSMKRTLGGALHALLTGRKIIKSFQPDTVQAHMFHSCIFSRVLRLITPIKYLICTEHSKYIGGSHRMLLYRLTDWLSDINTNVSEEATRAFINSKAFSKKKSFTIYNGIDLAKFSKRLNSQVYRQRLNIPDDWFVFLNVGRLTEAKNQKLLLNAFSKVASIIPNARLVIVGEGELREQLIILSRDLGIQSKVLFMGITNEIESFYHSADCFVLSSDWEGFGLVLAEAMAASLPVITTDAGGCAEVVYDRDYIVAVGAMEALVSCMLKVHSLSLEELAILKEKNMESVTRFDSNLVFKQWEALYHRNIAKLTSLLYKV